MESEAERFSHEETPDGQELSSNPEIAERQEELQKLSKRMLKLEEEIRSLKEAEQGELPPPRPTEGEIRDKVSQMLLEVKTIGGEGGAIVEMARKAARNEGSEDDQTAGWEQADWELAVSMFDKLKDSPKERGMFAADGIKSHYSADSVRANLDQYGDSSEKLSYVDGVIDNLRYDSSENTPEDETERELVQQAYQTAESELQALRKELE